MAHISRFSKLQFAFEDLLSDYPSRTEITETLYPNEVSRICRLFPELEIKKLSNSSTRKKCRYVITKKDT